MVQRPSDGDYRREMFKCHNFPISKDTQLALCLLTLIAEVVIKSIVKTTHITTKTNQKERKGDVVASNHSQWQRL